MEIKICGITRVADAAAAAGLGADYLGLIMAASARRASDAVAKEVVAHVRDRARPVLLFRDQPLTEIEDRVGMFDAEYVQLHGSEDVEFVSRLRDALPHVSIIRAWELRDTESGRALRDYLSALSRRGVALHRVILDAPKGEPLPPDATFRSVADGWGADLPGLWRAGGLTPDNVVGALSGAGYRGVDAARGIETSPGRKDIALLRRFIDSARRAPDA